MKNRIVVAFIILFTANFCHSQEWMTSIDIAQKLALIQNKMVLMVWEESTKYPYPVLVNDDKGRTIFIGNLFEDENVRQVQLSSIRNILGKGNLGNAPWWCDVLSLHCTIQEVPTRIRPPGGSKYFG